MSDFLTTMKAAAKADKKTIVLPEGEDPRTIEAARQIVAEDIANLVILGDPAEIDVELSVGPQGDVNHDGNVSITDAVSVVNIILNNGSSSAPALQKDDVEVVPE